MENFYDAFAAGFAGGQTTPQIKQLMATTAAAPGQPLEWYQGLVGRNINSLTPQEAQYLTNFQAVRDSYNQPNPLFGGNPVTGDSGNDGGIANMPAWQTQGMGSRDRFNNTDFTYQLDQHGNIINGQMRPDDNSLRDFGYWAAGSALAGGAFAALGGAGAATLGGAEMATAGAGGLTPGMAGTGAFGTAAAAGAGAAGSAGSAAAGSGPMQVGGAGGLPAQAGAGGLSSLLGGAGGLGNLIGGLGSLWDTYQNYRNVGDMRDWLTSQTPDLPFYQDKLKTSYEDPGSYWQGADFNAGFDVLHNKLQRNDAAGGRLAADAGRQSELQKYTLDSLNNYRAGLAGVVNDQTRARVGANEAFMNNLNNRADAISPITTWLGNLMGNQ